MISMSEPRCVKCGSTEGVSRCALCGQHYCQECFSPHYCGEGEETYRDNPELPIAPHALPKQ